MGGPVAELKRSSRGAHRHRLPSDTVAPLGGWQECVRGSRIRLCLDGVDASEFPPPPPPEPITEEGAAEAPDAVSDVDAAAAPYSATAPNGNASEIRGSNSSNANGSTVMDKMPQRNGTHGENGRASPASSQLANRDAGTTRGAAKGHGSAPRPTSKRRHSSASSDSRSDKSARGKRAAVGDCN